ncbi:tRNA (adenosine(37)-N6)-threonylcarbamoyltransferase complex ATPase subunit type 1 TsaE [Mongoliimonas terrestris]|uniref:tRNA (adenosine(37)-N6)-threonylcarbamoyltransferase complex ATPase subunit type 1 TsaE n=1 Tax=Mongoliimonas terrestris TaxID=1709001 RepID=UPI0009F86513|nr:tRNA (adenosine(37)-N6)-threonylcarbamoyltransferase complex ATPase subunit type 1 TsaE [Mongoliimonas terrestris]
MTGDDSAPGGPTVEAGLAGETIRLSAETIRLADEADTRALAEDLAAVVRPGDVIALSGDLGMGKSAFARFLIRALAGDDALEVPSPTFTLAQTYALSRLTVAHFDLYRLGDPGELSEIGFDAATREAVVLVEWPERAVDALPPDTLVVAIRPGDGPTVRQVTLAGDKAAWGDRLDRTRAIRRLLVQAGLGPARRRHLQGDASNRAYERATAAGESAVVMNWPPPPPGPVIADGLTYAALAHIQTRATAVVAVNETLRAKGFRAAAVRAADLDRGLLVLEDLGAEPVVADGRPIGARYIAAAETLADIAGEDWPTTVALADGRAHTVPPYDARALLTEVTLFLDWYLPYAFDRTAGAGERADFLGVWGAAIGRLGRAETTWTLRDFHSPNLIWQPQGAGRTRLGLVDVQDTVIGPAAYDVASLATDARVDVPADLKAALLDAYAARRQAQPARPGRPAFDRVAFEEAFALSAAQRNAKILGGFARSARRDGKTTYLAHLPRVKAALAEALSHPVLGPVRLWYERGTILS